MDNYSILNRIKSPDDLKELDYNELNTLCGEIRHKMVRTVSMNGGHLSSNLGVVELTVALHKVFRSPVDQFVFDVGHQCYTHKLLTGRYDDFDTLRQEGGIAGFPKPCESEHDILIGGHSSTSISSACGLASAKALLGQEGYVVAVIGDGALSGGLAYEGLNNAGRNNNRLIVILNDNKMSISDNVGSMARYLASIRSKASYVKLKTKVDRALSRIPLVGKPTRELMFKSKALLRYVVYHSTLFEDMGFLYLGPVDGHNLKEVVNILNTVKTIDSPVLIHVCTVKGKGYSYAEQHPSAYHGISGFDIESGEAKISGDSYSDIFGKEMCRLAETNKKICAVTAAMKSGTGLAEFAEKFPNRFFDVGIAEQHAITFCGGLAANGLKPVFAVYSSFLQRGYDQIIHDVAIGGLNVVFAVDRAGIVGEDGETHNGMFDVALFNTVPNMTVYAPTYFSELRHFLGECLFKVNGPSAIRYPRGKEYPLPSFFSPSFANYDFLECGKENLIITYGRIFSEALIAIVNLKDKGSETSLLKLNRIKPIDIECVKKAAEYKNVFFFEEGVLQGGIGEHFEKLLFSNGFKGDFKLVAADTPFVSHQSTASALKKLGLSSDKMFETVMKGLEDDREKKT